MKELFNNEAFFHGIIFGIGLYQQKVIAAHKRQEAIIIGDDVFYTETGEERLERTLNEICK